MEKSGVSVESARDVAPSEARWRLVLGMDFTASNRLKTGSADSRSLHDLGVEAENPYLQALSILAMLSVCGGNGVRCHRPILAYGFGEARTASRAVFAFSDAGQPLGPVDVAVRYRSIARAAQLGGSCSFAPLIWQAIAQQRETGERHAVLVLARGDLQWSAQRATAQAVEEAAKHGIPVAVLGVGGGPFERIHRLCREKVGIRFAEFGRMASRFPFGRLQTAEDIYHLLAVPAGAPEKMQTQVQTHFASPMPMSPPDLVQAKDVTQVLRPRVESMLVLHVLLSVAVVLSVTFVYGRAVRPGIATVAALWIGCLLFRSGILSSACDKCLRKVSTLPCNISFCAKLFARGGTIPCHAA